MSPRNQPSQLSQFQKSSRARSLWQIANSFLPLIAICALMYATLDVSYALTLGLSLIAGGFVVRVFIIQHDCGHGAFFRTRRANTLVGTLCSLVTLTPYENWRRQHAGHHANWNNLDRRESGADIYSSCLTTDEYRALGPVRRLLYRMVRHPLVSQVILPPLIFLVLYRVPFDTPRAWRKERWVVHATNAAIAALVLGMGFTLGFRAVLMVQLPITLVASITGVWLFSVQHRFEATLWARQAEWSYAEASLRGCSYLRLPRLLQWFTGNIGFHHIHHWNPRIPNYRLEECHARMPALQGAPQLDLWTALKAGGFPLWDEARGKMVPFAFAQA